MTIDRDKCLVERSQERETIVPTVGRRRLDCELDDPGSRSWNTFISTGIHDFCLDRIV